MPSAATEIEVPFGEREGRMRLDVSQTYEQEFEIVLSVSSPHFRTE
jgi:hypothetical protein